MTMTENANLIEILKKLGWTGDQIADFILGIAGTISTDESAKRIKDGAK